MVRCGPWDGKTKRGRDSPERAESGEEFRGEEEEAPERDWISRKGLREGKAIPSSSSSSFATTY